MRGSLLSIVVLFAACSLPEKAGRRYDVVVYGGTSAGVIAAVRVARSGKSVVLVEPGSHLGGLTSGGLGMTDTGNRDAIGGMSREFYRRVKRHYDSDAAWTRQSKQDYRFYRTADDAIWRFEPHVAEMVFREMIREAGVPVVFGERLDLASGVQRTGSRIESIRMESGRVFAGRIFVDATYEGDLMAKAGVSYVIGREANAQYGETLNGVQTARAIKHQFTKPVDPYVEEGNPSSGLLPGVHGGSPGEEGAADHRVQAYCFRMCMTDDPDNRVPYPKPDGYDPLRYEILLRYIRAGWRNIFGNRAPMPNRKTDTNNNGAFSTDNIGMNYEYPDGDYATRARIIAEHETYQKGLMWFLANDPRIPSDLQTKFRQWGLAKDEFVDNGNWPHQLYIREARRMVSEHVHTELSCRRLRPTPDPVGMGSYNMDSHNVQRYVDATGHVRNEGDIQISPRGPYSISYRSIRPRREECTNLLVPVCLSASHAAYGSIRMEPVFMILGHSAATAATLALDGDVPVQDVEYDALRTLLVAEGQVLELPGSTPAESLDPRKLAGVVVDDAAARFEGSWTQSTSVGPFIGSGYRHDAAGGDGRCVARFEVKLPKTGRYEVRVAYSAHENRARRVPIRIEHAEGRNEVRVDQQRRPTHGPFVSLGQYPFDAEQPAVVLVSNENTTGYVVVDAVQFLPR